jgi:hypothetical protein
MVFKTWFCRQVDLPALVKHGEAGLDRGISTAGAVPVHVLIRVPKSVLKIQFFSSSPDNPTPLLLLLSVLSYRISPADLKKQL